MKALALILAALLFTGCSTTLIYAPKTIKVNGCSNRVEIKGSDLKGNDLEQDSSATIKPGI